jgi:hypothetical protein
MNALALRKSNRTAKISRLLEKAHLLRCRAGHPSSRWVPRCDEGKRPVGTRCSLPSSVAKKQQDTGLMIARRAGQ